jgi:mRNA interferase YafQ
MKELIMTNRFKKDLKRMKNNKQRIENVLRVLTLLAEEKEIPKEMRPHRLNGNWAGHWECHVENDLLLIWIDPDEEYIVLKRVGSHSEVFG